MKLLLLILLLTHPWWVQLTLAQCSGDQFQNKYYAQCVDCPTIFNNGTVACGVNQGSSIVCRYGYTSDEASLNYCNVCDDSVSYFLDSHGSCSSCASVSQAHVQSCSSAGIVCDPGWVTTNTPCDSCSLQDAVLCFSTPSVTTEIYMRDDIFRATPSTSNGADGILADSSITFRANMDGSIVSLGFMKRRCETVVTRQLTLRLVADVPIVGAIRSIGTFIDSLVTTNEPIGRDVWIWIPVQPQVLAMSNWYSLTVPREACTTYYQPIERVPLNGALTIEVVVPNHIWDPFIDVEFSPTASRSLEVAAIAPGLYDTHIAYFTPVPSLYSILRGVVFSGSGSINQLWFYVTLQQNICFTVASTVVGSSSILTQCAQTNGPRDQWYKIWQGAIPITVGVEYVAWYSMLNSDTTPVHMLYNTGDTLPTSGTFKHSSYITNEIATNNKPLVQRLDQLDYMIDVVINNIGFYANNARPVPYMRGGDSSENNDLGTYFVANVNGIVSNVGFMRDRCETVSTRTIELYDDNNNPIGGGTTTNEVQNSNTWIWVTPPTPIRLIAGMYYSVRTQRESCFLSHTRISTATRHSAGPLSFDSNIAYGSRAMEMPNDFVVDVVFVPDPIAPPPSAPVVVQQRVAGPGAPPNNCHL